MNNHDVITHLHSHIKSNPLSTSSYHDPLDWIASLLPQPLLAQIHEPEPIAIHRLIRSNPQVRAYFSSVSTNLLYWLQRGYDKAILDVANNGSSDTYTLRFHYLKWSVDMFKQTSKSNKI